MTSPERPAPIDVACLAMLDSEGRLFAARRPLHKSLGGLWELPGGKIDPGESPETALRRELREELGMETGALEPMPHHIHGYEFGIIRLWPLLARCDAARHPPYVLHEHTEARWVDARAAESLTWAPADVPLLGRIFSHGRTGWR